MYKYKLKEIEVGDVGVRGGVKSTVTDIDPITGGITWSITDVAAFDTVYKTFNKLKKFLKKLETTGEAEKDPVLDEISDKVEDLFSDYWTHIRSTYPEAYDKIKLTKESVNESLNELKRSEVEAELKKYQDELKKAERKRNAEDISVLKDKIKTFKGMLKQGNLDEAATERFLQSSARNLAGQMRGKSASRDTLMNRLNSMPLANRLKSDELDKIIDYTMQEMGLINEAKKMTFGDFLNDLDNRLLDILRAAKGLNAKDSNKIDMRASLNQNFTLFRNYISKLKKEYNNELGKELTFTIDEDLEEGEGIGYMTPKAFDKNKKSTGANDIYYYKLGYKPVPKKIKGSGLEVKQLFEKEELKEYSDFQQKRIQQFTDVEEKLNQISPLLSNAKNETAKFYNENPGSYEVVYSTDMIGSLIDDITELLKQEE